MSFSNNSIQKYELIKHRKQKKNEKFSLQTKLLQNLDLGRIRLHPLVHIIFRM